MLNSTVQQYDFMIEHGYDLLFSEKWQITSRQIFGIPFTKCQRGLHFALVIALLDLVLLPNPTYEFDGKTNLRLSIELWIVVSVHLKASLIIVYFW